MRVVAEMVCAVPGKTDVRVLQIAPKRAAGMRYVIQQKVVRTVRKIAGFVKATAAFPTIHLGVNSRELPIVSARHFPNAVLGFGIWLVQKRPKNAVRAVGTVVQQTVLRGAPTLLWNSVHAMPISSVAK